MLIRAAIFAEQEKFDEALKAADEAKAFASGQPDDGSTVSATHRRPQKEGSEPPAKEAEKPAAAE